MDLNLHGYYKQTDYSSALVTPGNYVGIPAKDYLSWFPPFFTIYTFILLWIV